MHVRNGQDHFAFHVPILVIGFNRPDFIHDLFRSLAPFKPARIFFAVDGPRTDHPEDVGNCKETAAQINTVDWPCEVHTRIRQENLGCKGGPPDAITWFFSHVDSGIILEDDCHPTESFLLFAEEMLARYANQPSVGMISGDSGYGFMTNPKDSYRFSQAAHIWGWATWRRFWDLYQLEPETYRHDLPEILRRSCLTRRGKKLLTLYYQHVLMRNDTWDVQLALTLRKYQMLSIAPRKTIVRNCGFETVGTHTQGFSYDAHLFTVPDRLDFPLNHPQRMERDAEADRKEELRSFAWLPRILTVVGLRGGRFGRSICSFFARVEPHAGWFFRL